ncbi:MAG: CBS domain-containing protein [Alphaproteobacteria bacterium]|nr:MAG: CBS domain-containing protein [Alphaproteobacteria bacterium]
MDRIEALVLRAPAVSPDTICADVFELFSSDDDLLAVAVVDGDRPIGLVNRHRLTLKLADRFGRPLFEKKPVTRLMDPKPLIIEADESVDYLGQLILDERPSALVQGFIVTRDGRYVGIGTALSLLQVNMARSRHRSEELERAKIAAETANRSKSMFLANMSHELRTPLNAIIGFTDFIRSETLGPIQPKQYADYINDVNESGKHLLNVINAILDMSKIEANRLELNEDYIDPEETAESVVRMMRATAERHRITVLLDVAPEIPDLHADGQLLRQILLNLLSNAIKFSNDGKEVVLRVALDEAGGLVFSVIDQGIGIAESDLERVMEPFGQADNSLSRQSEGTGLGLPLCKALAEAHGGRIRLASKPGAGTRVDVIFPAARTVGADAGDRLHSVA